MKTFKQYIEEHCKTGKYFGPFNMLQIKILDRLYYNHLKDKVDGFGDENILSNSDLITMFFNKLPDALTVLGGVLCRRIPDEKTLRYTGTDLNVWALELFELLRNKNENI